MSNVIKKSPAFLARLGAELAADESLDVHPSRIVAALDLLGLNADKIFERIRDDLNRGLIKEAREHLNFVDVMLSQRQNTEVSHE